MSGIESLADRLIASDEDGDETTPTTRTRKATSTGRTFSATVTLRSDGSILIEPKSAA